MTGGRATIQDVFHVRFQKGLLRSAEHLNLDAPALQAIVTAWLAGEPVHLKGRAWKAPEASITIYEGPTVTTNQRFLGQGWLNATRFGENITDEILSAGGPSPTSKPTPDPRTVAVSYGRDEEARTAMFGFLLDLGLTPLSWEDLIAATGEAMPYSGDAVERGFATAQAVVVLFTADEEARLHTGLRSSSDDDAVWGQPRPNVLLEAGSAMATHPGRTVIVEFGAIREFGNLAGRNVVRISNGVEALHALRRRLEIAGCQIEGPAEGWDDPARFISLAAMTRAPRRAR